jgi:hypothetical protein
LSDAGKFAARQRRPEFDSDDPQNTRRSFRGAPYAVLAPTDPVSIDGRSNTRIAGQPGSSHGLFSSAEYCLIAASKNPTTLLSLYSASRPRPAAVDPSSTISFCFQSANAETRKKDRLHVRMRSTPEKDSIGCFGRRDMTIGDA